MKLQQQLRVRLPKLRLKRSLPRPQKHLLSLLRQLQNLQMQKKLLLTLKLKQQPKLRRHKSCQRKLQLKMINKFKKKLLIKFKPKKQLPFHKKRLHRKQRQQKSLKIIQLRRLLKLNNRLRLLLLMIGNKCLWRSLIHSSTKT